MASSSQPPPPPPDPDIPSHPSDIELAMMLRARVYPSAPPPGNTITIHLADVYAQDPVDLTQQFAPAVAADGQIVWYFFTTLSQRGKRKRRGMDSGVWKGEGKSKDVVGSQARRYLFAFLNNDGARTGWIMHEFRLAVPDGNEESPVVLCKVFRSNRRCAPNPAMNNESAAEEAQVQAQAAVEVEVEALVQAVEARMEAVVRMEAAVEARMARMVRMEGAVEARVARIVRMEAARQQQLETERWRRIFESREGRTLAWDPRLAHELMSLSSEEFELRLVELREAELAMEAELREAEGDALARREAARLAAWERDLQERERNLTAREAAENSRRQAIYEELLADVEALVLILMAAIMMAARAGLLLPIAGGSRAAIAHCSGALLEPLF